MPRYIDADMLKELIDKGYDINFDEVPETKKALLNMIDYQETADVIERKRGEWILELRRDWDGTHWHKECSECSYELDDSNKNMNFCPNCGAEMEVSDGKIHDADAVMRLIPMEEPVARMAIANTPTADEEKIATEYCKKRCLVMMTMDTYETLIACYNRCAGLRDERKDPAEVS